MWLRKRAKSSLEKIGGAWKSLFIWLGISSLLFWALWSPIASPLARWAVASWVTALVANFANKSIKQ